MFQQHFCKSFSLTETEGMYTWWWIWWSLYCFKTGIASLAWWKKASGMLWFKIVSSFTFDSFCRRPCHSCVPSISMSLNFWPKMFQTCVCVCTEIAYCWHGGLSMYFCLINSVTFCIVLVIAWTPEFMKLCYKYHSLWNECSIKIEVCVCYW